MFASFAKSDNDDPAVIRAAEELEKINSKKLEGILKEVSKANDLEEAEDILSSLDLSDDESAEVLRAVLINGFGAGLADVTEG
jgi:hypothetical protein